ncbi:MAG: O-antigen ligase [Planctomycetota bacterium]|jgi:O-antigen ligase
MMDSAEESSKVPQAKILPWLLILPLVLLVWPKPSFFAGDFATTEATAAAVSALLLTPLALWLLCIRPLPHQRYLLLMGALFLPIAFGVQSDSLEMDRALQTYLIATLAATGAASLSQAGKLKLVRGLASTSILLTLPALFDATQDWSGVLGNSGELSGAALPGAFCGMTMWARETTRWRWIGMGASGLFLLHALLAPVLASLLLLAFAAAGAFLLGKALDVNARSRLLGVLILTIAGAGWVKFSSSDPTPAPATVASTEAPATHFGGFEVRGRIWLASFEMFKARKLLGAGAGQFAVHFPEYRDQEELELSTWQHKIEQNTEVENPHNDWLLPWLEGGVLAGFCWMFFLGSVLLAGFRKLKHGDAVDATIALGALGTIAGATFNAPLLYNPLASLASFLLIGSLLGPHLSRPSKRWKIKHRAQAAPFAMAVLLLLSAPAAWSSWRHGSAIAEIGKTESVTAQAEAVEAALAARPDSVVALSMQARLREGRDGDLEGALLTWEKVLELRPLRFEAWMQKGVVLARLQRRSEARDAFDRALDLDSTHPGLARNRVMCFAQSNMIEESLAEVSRLEALGEYDNLWLLELSASLLLRGQVDEALPMLYRADSRFSELSGEDAWEIEAQYRRNGNRMVADAFRALAGVIWARGQAEAEEWADARRSYFQALRIMRDYHAPDGPLRTRLEHAASIWFEGSEAEAREQFEISELKRLNWTVLPRWTSAALFSMGVTQAGDE